MHEGNQNKKTFGDLPQALVDEILEKSKDVSKSLFTAFEKVQKKKKTLREQLISSNLLKSEADLNLPTPPTTCGVDGSCAREELLSVDLLTATAVAVEGLIPPSETRYWPINHDTFIKEEKHNPETNTILNGIMFAMEQILAENAPHDVVFMDGSLATPFIHLNQAIEKGKRNKDLEISKSLNKLVPQALNSYHKIIINTRGDKLWIGIPKKTTKREIGEKFRWEKSYDDRAILTHILSAGELILPIDFEQPKEPWHLNYEKSKVTIKEIINALQNLKVMYYKPNSWTPALRIELPNSAANNKYQIAMVIQALKYQCSPPGIFEPYPLFMADRMVKSLGVSLPAFRQIITRQMAEDYKGDMGEIFFSMHGYRSEKYK